MRSGKQFQIICLMLFLLLIALLPVAIAVHAYRQPVVNTGVAGSEVADCPATTAEKGTISFDFPFVPLLN